MGVDAVTREQLRERLTYDCPFWAGGIKRGPNGEVIRPGRDDWQGCARIVNKARLTVPLIANDWQIEFDDKLEAQRAAGLPMRAIVLKARQLGISTWVGAKITQRLTMLDHQSAVIVAQDTRTAGSIFNMAELMHAQLPAEHELGLGFSIKPDRTGGSFSESGRKFLTFGTRSRRQRESGRSGDSVLDIDTAMSPESGRGKTRNLVHLSEVGKWPDRATGGTASKMISVLNSVPYLPETLVVLESTANGLNHFYRRWLSARDGQGDPESGETYVAVFVPWWRDPAYAMPFSNAGERGRFVESIGDTRRFGELADDEPMLVESFGCSPEQLRWRRMQIRTQHEGSVQLFKQENPASDEEAFISSGRPYFAGILVTRALKAAEASPEPVRGSLRGEDWRARRTRSGAVYVPQRAVWVPEAECVRGMPWNGVPRDGRVDDELESGVSYDAPLLEVWEHPVTAASQSGLPAAERREPGAYVVAADVAEGETDTFTQETDYHAVTVWDHRARTQVAQYDSRIDRHLLPLWLYLIGLYYNEAVLAVEVNSVGMSVNDPLKSDYKYRHLYRRRRVDHVRNTVEAKFGWRTTAESKPLIEDAMGQALQSDTRGGIRSVKTARQLSTYIKDDRGRRGALPGEHDDLLISAMIAQRVMEEMRPQRAGKGTRRPFQPMDDVTGY